MMTAQNNRHTTPAKFICNLIGPPRGECLYRDPDKVAMGIEFNLFEAIIQRLHLHIGWRDSRQRGKRKRRKLPGWLFAKVPALDHGRFHYRDVHNADSLSF